MEDFLIYVGGEFVATNTKIDVYNSYLNETFASTYLAGKDELELAIERALKVKNEMAALPAFVRYEILNQIAFGIKEKRELFAKLIAQEACKPLRFSRAEVDRAIQCFVIAAEESKRLPAEYFSVDWTPAGKNKEGLVKHFPIGLIAGIAPFNFPLNLAVHKIAPAIASGNPIILKPARSTPTSVLELAKIIDQTSLPKGGFSVLPMDRQSGNQLVTDPRIKLLTFTGSPEVGWKMKQEAGKKRITLELGGNAGVIVSSSADLEQAVAKCLWGSFAYSGQICIHVQRIFVHDSLFADFSKMMVSKVEKLIIGNPLDPETDFSSMIDFANAIRVETWVDEAIADGAKVICGGHRKDNYFEPTILTNSNNSMKVCNQEAFGPVVTLERFEKFEDAVNQVNQSEYGLQAGVFTNLITEMNYAFQNLEVGGVIINDVPTFRVDHMPYGGIKNSGFGREGIKYAIHEMLEPKLLVKDQI